MRKRERTVGRELEALYERRFAEFVQVATVIAGEGRATDVVQETFARALASSDRYRGDGPLEAWVWRILINTARTDLRHPQAVGAAIDASQATGNGHSADHSPVRTWIASLPERQRLVVFLRYYADLDYRSIAVALGIEIGTVSATLSAAHTALRRLIKEVPR